MSNKLSVVVNAKAKTMTITLPYDPKGTESASKKTRVVASTRGNKPVEVEGREIYVGVNAYVYNDAA